MVSFSSKGKMPPSQTVSEITSFFGLAASRDAERTHWTLPVLAGNDQLCCSLGQGRPALQQSEPSGEPAPHHHARTAHTGGADLSRVVTSLSGESSFYHPATYSKW